MPFRLIKGTFQPTFGFPDGDSLRFVPDNPEPIFHLIRRKKAPKLNPNNGSIQLRYEAIDTMEKSAGSFAEAATLSNLDLAGTQGGTQSARGYICSNQLGPNGRPIAFVFAGDTDKDDGSSVYLEPDDIMESINVKQFERGHAYPLFYDTLFDDLRQRCTEVVLAAKQAGNGVWSADTTNSGASWTGNVDTLEPIFPKLWRRIDKYVNDETFFDPTRPFANLKIWMEQSAPERVAVLSESIFTGFDNLVETTDTTVRMTFEPRQIVVVSS